MQWNTSYVQYPNLYGDRYTLTGGTGVDNFILYGGPSFNNGVYYDDLDRTTAGLSDYALITDFNPKQDIIRLTSDEINGGPIDVNYRLGESPSGLPTGTAIFVDKPGTEPDELIAILQNIAPDSLSLTASYFQYFSVV